VKVTSATFWQTTFAFTFIVNLVILIWSIFRWVELKVIMWRSVWMIPLALYLSALAACVFMFIWIRKGNANRLLAALDKSPSGKMAAFCRLFAGVVFIGIMVLIPTLKFTFRIGEVVKKSTQDPILTTIVFYWLVWWLVLAAAGALKLAFKTSWAGGFSSALVFLGLAYEIFIRFQLVSAYPFSMGWSESSRFYYGSLYFAKSIYGLQLPLPSLHPSRYLLQAFPFLFSGLDLAANRFWQFLLWMGLSGISAIVLAWRTQAVGLQALRLAQWGLKALFAGWFFLFLLRVGVYYHLEVMLFVPLLFVSAKHPWRSLVALIFASAWAGISRVNWFPIPAMIAIALYLLEEPVSLPSSSRSIWAYLARPAAWGVVGMLTALAAQAAYIPLSGNADNAQAFASSFSSPKLWYRLWPNDSYPLGIVPAILIVSGPLILTLILATIKKIDGLHPVRWAGLWAMLVVLFAGGLVVSVKIGGGGDLHNMDAFAVLLVVVAAYFIGDKVRWENGSDTRLPPLNGRSVTTLPGNWLAFSWPVAATGLLIPLVFLVPRLAPVQQFHQDANQQAFSLLKGLAEQAGQKGPVLFINERHLVTFGKIIVPLVPEYEAVTLMEMAMSNNQPYLQRFYNDLKSHRFAAIVTGKQNVGIKEEGAFAEENNTWNSRVSPYILCYYEPVIVVTAPEAITYIEADESRIEFYLPRATPGVCP
jgi:hypothetical protein